MLAASNNHAAAVDTLAAHDADLDHAEPGLGWTALIWAAKQGHEATVRVLIAQGADANPMDPEGHTAADWARIRGYTRIHALLSP